MIKRILIFLGFAHSPKSLAKKSAAIHSVFTTTVDQLNVVNAKLNAEQAKRAAIAKQAMDESSEMELQKQANAKTIFKLTDFLS